jgi:hypothetical protein
VFVVAGDPRHQLLGIMAIKSVDEPIGLATAEDCRLPPMVHYNYVAAFAAYEAESVRITHGRSIALIKIGCFSRRLWCRQVDRHMYS